MLVLSRKPGEKIHIGCGIRGGITITLVRIQGQRVRIVIDAPEDVPVVRAEINDVLGHSAEEPLSPRTTPARA